MTARLRWAEVDLSAIAHNVAALRSRLDPGTALAAVVKANAYGHGAVPVARQALASGAGWLAVATLHEAEELRRASVDAPILLMGPVPEGGEAQAISLELRLTVYEPDSIERLSMAAKAGAGEARLHLKVDTGMGRLGCPPEQAPVLARRIATLPGLLLEGLWTHFAEADDAGSAQTPAQFERFQAVVAALAAENLAPPVLHCANSAAALQFPSTRLVLVRCGLPIYGYQPTLTPVQGLDLRPAMSWKSRIVALHELAAGDRVGYGGTYVAAGPRRVATIATGYADGYPRALGGRGQVLVRGARAAVVGRVSMDFITADVSALPDAALGDEVTIIGTQGGERVGADDIAASLGTISWEVLTMVGPRVERVPVGHVAAAHPGEESLPLAR